MLLFVDSVDVLKFWIGVVESFWLFVGSVAFILMDAPEWDRVIAESVDANGIEFVLSVAESVEWISTLAVETFPLPVTSSNTVWVAWWISVAESTGNNFEELRKSLLVVVSGDPRVVNDSLLSWRVGLVEKVEVGGSVISFVVV